MRHYLILLAALPNIAGANNTEFVTQDRLLNDVSGNQVHISTSKAKVEPPATTFVSVCLAVPGTHRHSKGLQTQAQAPRFTPPDQVSCIRVAPMAQRIVLLTRANAQAAQRSMAFTADLTSLGGHQLNINWIIEVVK